MKSLPNDSVELIKFGHARAQIKFKKQEGEIRHLLLHYSFMKEKQGGQLLKNDSIAAICLCILQYFEKQLLPRTLMNNCLSKLLTTGDRKRYSICINTILGLQA